MLYYVIVVYHLGVAAPTSPEGPQPGGQAPDADLEWPAPQIEEPHRLWCLGVLLLLCLCAIYVYSIWFVICVYKTSRHCLVEPEP